MGRRCGRTRTKSCGPSVTTTVTASAAAATSSAAKAATQVATSSPAEFLGAFLFVIFKIALAFLLAVLMLGVLVEMSKRMPAEDDKKSSTPKKRAVEEESKDLDKTLIDLREELNELKRELNDTKDNLTDVKLQNCERDTELRRLENKQVTESTRLGEKITTEAENTRRIHNSALRYSQAQAWSNAYHEKCLANKGSLESLVQKIRGLTAAAEKDAADASGKIAKLNEIYSQYSFSMAKTKGFGGIEIQVDGVPIRKSYPAHADPDTSVTLQKTPPPSSSSHWEDTAKEQDDRLSHLEKITDSLKNTQARISYHVISLEGLNSENSRTKMQLHKIENGMETFSLRQGRMEAHISDLRGQLPALKEIWNKVQGQFHNFHLQEGHMKAEIASLQAKVSALEEDVQKIKDGVYEDYGNRDSDSDSDSDSDDGFEKVERPISQEDSST